MPITIGKLNEINLGISGACYDEKNDILLLTASAEDTSNAYDDGEIIGSVIGVVYNAYQKLNSQEIVIDEANRKKIYLHFSCRQRRWEIRVV